MMSMAEGDARRHGATHATNQPATVSTASMCQLEALREKAPGLVASSERNEPKEPASRVKIHMHPAKRRLLLVLALGSVLGCILVVATMRFVVTPLQQWHASPHHDAVAQLKRLQLDMERLRDTTAGSTERMKEFLHQMQRVHAASTSRTALVEKAAAQSYREHARDHIREHFMAIKEGILVQTSQRRRIEDAREELQSMGLTADALLQRLDPNTEEMIEGLAQQKHTRGDYGGSFANQTSASSSLAQSIRSIRLAMLEHSLEAQNATSADEAVPVSREADSTESLTTAEPQPTAVPTNPQEHGVVVYLVVFGLVGVWMWSVVTDERTRKTSMVFHTHRAVWKMLSGIIVVERVDGGDEFMGVDGR